MTAYLLDSHAVLWWWTESALLGHAARQVIENGADRICVSVASVWEIAIKSQAGRLPEVPAFRAEYPGLIAASGFELVGITDRHALEAAYLRSTHRDPFDRMIAGQARCEAMTVITRDRQIAGLGCEVLW